MEWDPSERDAWVADAQRWICQIKGVLQCKIDLDPAGVISGVHVVAGMGREPRHIVRDVESLLKARLQMDVFYKKIGVVQVLDSTAPVISAAASDPDDPPQAAVSREGIPGPSGVTFHPPLRGSEGGCAADPAPRAKPAASPQEVPDPIPAILVAEGLTPRITCSGVGVMASDMLVRAEVQLRVNGVEARGKREGANHADSDVQLVARATLDAVAELLNEPVLLHLNEIRILPLGGKTVVMAAVDLVEGRVSDTLFGTCSTVHNRQQAVVHAVLDALNRRLSMYAVKTVAADA